MKILILGLGSMGKRRIRCLKHIGHYDIFGFDIKEDRREEAKNQYGITVLETKERINYIDFDVFIISVPPDKHNEYLEIAISNKKPAFVEAGVLFEGLDLMNSRALQEKVLIAPSCTLKFHSAIKDIKYIVKSKKYGEITNFSYHSGQYLPDWHPWENVRDYYVSKKLTGACREIVVFELSWLIDILGFPDDYKSFFGATTDVGAEIDDTYIISLKFRKSYGSLVVDVVSRYAIRNLILNMELGQIQWNWDIPQVRLFDANKKRWILYNQSEESSAEKGYNKNIIEKMYIDEMICFFEALNTNSEFPNNLDEEIKIRKILYNCENKLK